MAEIVNLNKARKAKDRSERQAKAAENRVRFGRTRVEKRLERVKVEKAEAGLEAHRRTRPDSE